MRLKCASSWLPIFYGTPGIMVVDGAVEKVGETGHILISQSQSWLPMLICIEIYIRMCVHSSADLWSERELRKCSGAKFMANHNAKVRYGGASPNPEACATSSLGSDFYPRTPRGPSAPSRYPTAAL